MQGLSRYGPLADGGVRLELAATTASPLAIDVAESFETRIQRLIAENPVIIFSRSSCYMCHVMKSLLSTIGVHPTVIELDDEEIAALCGGASGSPALYIGGACVGGLESLVALHLSNSLVPKLVEVGALGNEVLIRRGKRDSSALGKFSRAKEYSDDSMTAASDKGEQVKDPVNEEDTTTRSLRPSRAQPMILMTMMWQDHMTLLLEMTATMRTIRLKHFLGTSES